MQVTGAVLLDILEPVEQVEGGLQMQKKSLCAPSLEVSHM
jgi:hypothetical protein